MHVVHCDRTSTCDDDIESLAMWEISASFCKLFLPITPVDGETTEMLRSQRGNRLWINFCVWRANVYVKIILLTGVLWHEDLRLWFSRKCIGECLRWLTKYIGMKVARDVHIHSWVGVSWQSVGERKKSWIMVNEIIHLLTVLCLAF